MHYFFGNFIHSTFIQCHDGWNKFIWKYAVYFMSINILIWAFLQWKFCIQDVSFENYDFAICFLTVISCISFSILRWSLNSFSEHEIYLHSIDLIINVQYIVRLLLEFIHSIKCFLLHIFQYLCTDKFKFLPDSLFYQY